MNKIIIVLIILVAIVGITLYVKKIYAPRPDLYDCSDFKTYKDAYDVFKRHSIDVYDLDKDHDGIPCETLLNK